MNEKLVRLGACFLLSILFLFCMAGCGGDAPSGTPTSETIIEPGALVKIECESSSAVCSTSKENHQQLGKYARAKDRKGMEEMLKQGKIFLVEKGATAKVLQTTLTEGIEIKIQDGKHKGTECWTERNFLTRVEE